MMNQEEILEVQLKMRKLENQLAAKEAIIENLHNENEAYRARIEKLRFIAISRMQEISGMAYNRSIRGSRIAESLQNALVHARKEIAVIASGIKAKD